VDDLGLVLGANSLGFMLLSLPGGLLADRIRRGLLLVIALTVRASSVVALVLVSLSDFHLVPWLILMFVEGTGRALNWPAYQSMVADLLPDAFRQAGNALGAASLQATGVVGPMLGGVLVTFTGTTPTMLIDAGVFGLALVTLMRISQRPMTDGQCGSIRGVIVEPVRVLRHRPWLTASIISNGIQLTLVIPAVYLILPLVARRYGSGGYGMMLATQAAGSFIATFLAARWRPRRRGIVAYSALSSLGVLLSCVVVTDSVLVVFASLLLSGIGVTLYTTYWYTAIQDEVSAERMGGVIGLTSVFSLGPLGFASTGYLLSTVDLWVVSLLADLALCVAIVLPLTMPGGTELRTEQAVPPPE